MIPPTVRMMDAIAGVANVALGGEEFSPAGAIRRRWYGRAGEYRYSPSKDGSQPRLEWRTPDTVLLCHPSTFNLMFDLSRTACRMGMQGLNFLWHAEEDEIRTAINECDVRLARKILTRNEKILRRVLEKCSPGYVPVDTWISAGMRAFQEGIHAIVRDPMDVVGNWLIDEEKSSRWLREGERNIASTPLSTWSQASLKIAQRVKI
jgi:hypothetical protein